MQVWLTISVSLVELVYDGFWYLECILMLLDFEIGGRH